MSEFTEVYFLHSNKNEEAIKLLKMAELKGYVFPAREGWVAFVADTEPLFEFSEKLKALNKGILLYFENAEDYGWGFSICIDSEMVCDYQSAFDFDMSDIIRKRSTDKDKFKTLLKAENGKFKILNKYFDENMEAEGIDDAIDFTRNMKIYFSDWISYHYVDLTHGEFEKYGDYDNLKLIKVN